MKMKNLLLFLLALIAVAPAWGDTAASASWAGVAIELKGSAKSVSALLADLEKEAVYKGAACTAAKKHGKTAKITCEKADSGLMDFLGKNAPATVQWSISSSAAGGRCTTGCALMACPITVVCCSITTHKPC